jgi:hypothetical protein
MFFVLVLVMSLSISSSKGEGREKKNGWFVLVSLYVALSHTFCRFRLFLINKKLLKSTPQNLRFAK